MIFIVNIIMKIYGIPTKSSKGIFEITMKFTRILSLVLAGSFLVACTPKAPIQTTVNTTTPTAQAEKAPVGAITPGKAEDQLIQSQNAYTLYSPDGTLAITITTNGQMGYSVSRTRDGDTIEWVKPSTLGVEVSKKSFCKDVTVTSATVQEVKVSYPLYGNQKTVDGHCMEAILNLSESDAPQDGYRLR